MSSSYACLPLPLEGDASLWLPTQLNVGRKNGCTTRARVFKDKQHARVPPASAERGRVVMVAAQCRPKERLTSSRTLALRNGSPCERGPL
ncbi:hypothetical protein NDU88_002354 [Pleurodeles waltl]|uniref:Uncharacterized protein n=1 Tax=Pleurodeles waltl TaxID=8319 RepID=A0AAV7RA10_PLEWA|nr:hypothetical protein NDU88_002354 [Pleurodeles waltl]